MKELKSIWYFQRNSKIIINSTLNIAILHHLYYKLIIIVNNWVVQLPYTPQHKKTILYVFEVAIMDIWRLVFPYSHTRKFSPFRSTFWKWRCILSSYLHGYKNGTTFAYKCAGNIACRQRELDLYRPIGLEILKYGRLYICLYRLQKYGYFLELIS